MRIVGMRVDPLAGILAIIYAVFGWCAFVLFAVSKTDYLTLPFGVWAPLFHFNVNLNLDQSSSMFGNIVFCIAALLSYALTGWITGVVVGLCFNAVAKQTGGIDAKYVPVAIDETTPKPILCEVFTLCLRICHTDHCIPWEKSTFSPRE